MRQTITLFFSYVFQPQRWCFFLSVSTLAWNIMHDHPSYLCCPNVLSLVGDPLSGNGCGSPNHIYIYIYIFFFFQCHHMSFADFVVLPPGHDRSVTDFWGWDGHEAQLRCPDGVWVVIVGDVVPGGALNLNSTNLPRPWSLRESSPSRKIPTVEPEIEPGTSWLVVRDSDH